MAKIEEEIKKISYYSFLNNDNNSKNLIQDESSFINNDLYMNIDSKNYLLKTSKNDIEIINERIEKFKETKLDENETKKENLTKEITQKFLDKLYPKCETSVSKISLSISRDIRGIKKLSTETIEEYIDYFYSLRHEIKYLKALKLNKDLFTNLGYLFCYIYSKFTQFKIKEISRIKEYLKTVIEKNTDVLTDYFFYCQENGIDPIQIKKTEVWKILSKKYEVPPELIFLVNIL